MKPAQDDPDEVIRNRSKAPVKPIDEGNNDGTKANDDNGASRKPKLNLDAKIAWRTEPQHTRTAFHAKSVNVSVARRARPVDTNWTPVPTPPTGTQLVKK